MSYIDFIPAMLLIAELLFPGTISKIFGFVVYLPLVAVMTIIFLIYEILTKKAI